MAQYQDDELIVQFYDKLFDQVYPAGARTPHSGIFRCEGCGHEIASAYPRSLPSSDHHEHRPEQGLIRWRLIVAAKNR
jgi:hypothetical protein